MRWATVHRLTGVAAALMVVFVESVIVTYFIGTSRWCREVVETYQFDRRAIRASNRLKRKTFPWALLGMLAVVGVSALGAAADTAIEATASQAWALWHLISGLLGIVLIAWTYVVAWNNILANHAIIKQLVADVGRVRQQRGLDSPVGPLSPSQ
jgi:hypothetical protein